MCCTPHRRPTCTAQSFLQSCLGRGCNCYANSIPLRGVSSSEAHYLYLIDNRPQSTVARISHGLPSERLPVYTARLGLYYTNGLMQPDLRVLLCGTPHKFSSVTAPTARAHHFQVTFQFRHALPLRNTLFSGLFTFHYPSLSLSR